MAIKAGQVLYVGNNQFLIDRIQQAGVPNLNIPRDRIFEVGNYLTLGNIRDIPDLGFSIDSYSVDTELFALLCGLDPTKVKFYNQNTLVNSGNSPTINYVDPANLRAFDLVSPFKSTDTLNSSTTSTSVRGVAVPFMFLESIAMQFGTTALSSFTYNLRGDAIYHCPGTPYVYVTPALSASTGPFAFTLPSAAGGGTTTALPYNVEGVDTYALNVTEIKQDGTNQHRRLVRGVDFTETSSGITLTATPTTGGTNGTCTQGSLLRIVFASATTSTFTETGSSTDFPGAITSGSNIHTSVAGDNPAALRGRFVEVYIGMDTQATPKPKKFTRVQSANVNWRVNLERDEEFNNLQIVDMSYNDVPDISGSLTVKTQSPTELFDKIAQVCNTNTATPHITGPVYNGTVPVEFKLRNPVDGTCLLDIYIPNASFDVPGYNSRVQQKMTNTFNFYSEDGQMQIYHGDRPGSF